MSNMSYKCPNKKIQERGIDGTEVTISISGVKYRCCSGAFDSRFNLGNGLEAECIKCGYQVGNHVSAVDAIFEQE